MNTHHHVNSIDNALPTHFSNDLSTCYLWRFTNLAQELFMHRRCCYWQTSILLYRIYQYSEVSDNWCSTVIVKGVIILLEHSAYNMSSLIKLCLWVFFYFSSWDSPTNLLYISCVSLCSHCPDFKQALEINLSLLTFKYQNCSIVNYIHVSNQEHLKQCRS